MVSPYFLYFCAMKTKLQKLIIKSNNKEELINKIFEQIYLRGQQEFEREKKVLADKFEIHINGKEKLLENSK
jgi:hypothetical protein